MCKKQSEDTISKGFKDTNSDFFSDNMDLRKGNRFIKGINPANNDNKG